MLDRFFSYGLLPGHLHIHNNFSGHLSGHLQGAGTVRASVRLPRLSSLSDVRRSTMLSKLVDAMGARRGAVTLGISGVYVCLCVCLHVCIATMFTL